MLPSFEDISSPFDWPKSLPEMRDIDNLLRCSICKEYFNVAVLIRQCSHNYCSLCIRESIINKTHCPTCSVSISGNDLKCNRVLDELVKNFVKVRSKLLELIKAGLSERKKNEESDDCEGDFMKTPKGKNYVLPKRKPSKGKSPKTALRNKRKREKEHDSDSDADYTPIKQEITPKKKSKSDKVQSNKGIESIPATQTPGPSSYVECPACGTMTDIKIINNHLDMCLTRQQKKSTLRNKATCDDGLPAASTASTSVSCINSPPTSSPSSSSSTSSKTENSVTGSNAFISNKPKRKHIKGIVYNLLKDRELKQKLKEWNLSTQGDRSTLIKRHQEFVTIYNANCDTNNPKSVSLIVKEIESRENQKRLKTFSSISTESAFLHVNKDSSTEEVDKAREKTFQQYGGQFEQLVKNTKLRRKKAVESTEGDQPRTVSHNIGQDSNQGSIPTGMKTRDSDSLSAHSKPREESTARRTNEDQPSCSKSGDDCNSEKTTDNDGCGQDVVDSIQEMCPNSPAEKSREGNIEGSKDPQRLVPNPLALSSLVEVNDADNNDNDDDDKVDSVVDLSLELVSSGEEDNNHSNSESDKELFKYSFESSQVKVRTLRRRKR